MRMIPKKWTKEGKEEIRAEKERLAKLESTIVGLARLMVEHSLYHDYAVSRGLFEDPWWERHLGLHSKTDSMLRKRYFGFGGKAYNAAVRGSAAADDPDHYAIDDAVAEAFGSNVICDSEGCELFIQCTPDIATDVLELVCHMAPKGSFSTVHIDPHDPDIRIELIPLDLPFIEWTGAQQFLKAKGIEVTVDFSDAPGPSQLNLNKAQTYLESAVRLIKPELTEDEVEGLARGLWNFVETAKTKKKKRPLRPRVNRD